MNIVYLIRKFGWNLDKKFDEIWMNKYKLNVNWMNVDGIWWNINEIQIKSRWKLHY